MNKFSLLRVLTAGALFVGIQYSIVLVYHEREERPTLLGLAVEEVVDDASLRFSSQRNVASSVLPRSQSSQQRTNQSKPSSVVGSFQMPKNETLEMERYLIFNNSTEFPSRKVFMRKYKPTANAKFLLDYVVAGFAKCGTTAIGEWLRSQEEISSPAGEQYYYGSKPEKMIMELYQRKKSRKSRDSKIGFRCPHHIQTRKGLWLLREPYFSQAKIIISVRHPVDWFQSYYNYRIEVGETGLLRGTPNELIGNLKCKGCNAMWILSTARGAFHYFMAALNKTPMNSTQELNLLTPFGQVNNKNNVQKSSSPNKVFLMEMRQLGDANKTRANIFQRDMQEFLGLKQKMTPLRQVRPQKEKREKQQKLWALQQNQSTTDDNSPQKIDICDEQYLPVRMELMRISRNASIWFRNYFLKSQDAFASSPEYLVELLQTWMVDPCDSSM